MVYLEIYSTDLVSFWDSFVDKSKNGTFLIRRSYMDYHKDKFKDLSLVFYSSKHHMCGVFPITVDAKNGIASSHNGLTYGGLVILPNTEYDQISEMLNKCLGFLRRNGITEFYYKPIPYIYHKYPSQEDLYWLYVNGFNLYSRSISSVIDLNNSIPFSALRLRKIKKAMESNGFEFSVCDASEDPQLWKSYWKLLCNVLSDRHNTCPVHTYEEISYLRLKNPHNIKLYIIFDKYKQEILAGVVAYETDLVMHCQYIASSDVGFKFNALDFLFNWMIDSAKSRFRYFDFGVSTEQNGLFLNNGLLFQKQGFGGRGICYDTYKLLL